MNRENLHFLQSIDPLYGGGLISSCLQLADAQIQLGETAKVFSTTISHTNSINSHDFIDVAMCKWPKAFLYAPGLLAGLKYLPENALIHNHGLYMYTSYLATKLKKEKHYHMVQHVHGMFEPWILSRSKWKKALVSALFENYKYQNAEYWRALTSKEADQIKSFGVKGQLILAPNGIDFNPINDYLVTADKKPNNKRRIGFIGRLHEKKGLRPFLKALQHVSDATMRNWEFVIAGPDEGVLGELVPFLSNNENVTWIGEVTGSKKYDFLNSLDLFVLPSFSEGFSMAILEACAFNIPVFITDQCNFEEAYAHGAIRLDNDRHQWNNDLNTVLSMSESELLERGICLRKLVEEKYSWQHIAADINDQICK